jgi:hypothetical protein
MAVLCAVLMWHGSVLVMLCVERDETTEDAEGREFLISPHNSGCCDQQKDRTENIPSRIPFV